MSLEAVFSISWNSWGSRLNKPVKWIYGNNKVSDTEGDDLNDGEYYLLRGPGAITVEHYFPQIESMRSEEKNMNRLWIPPQDFLEGFWAGELGLKYLGLCCNGKELGFGNRLPGFESHCVSVTLGKFCYFQILVHESCIT